MTPRGCSRLEAVLRPGKRSGLCSGDATAIADLVGRADDELFETVLRNSHHVLHDLLPKETDSCYDFRHRRHNRIFANKTSDLADSDIIIRMIYKDMYYTYVLTIIIMSIVPTAYSTHFIYCITLRFVKVS